MASVSHVVWAPRRLLLACRLRDRHLTLSVCATATMKVLKCSETFFPAKVLPPLLPRSHSNEIQRRPWHDFRLLRDVSLTDSMAIICFEVQETSKILPHHRSSSNNLINKTCMAVITTKEPAKSLLPPRGVVARLLYLQANHSPRTLRH